MIFSDQKGDITFFGSFWGRLSDSEAAVEQQEVIKPFKGCTLLMLWDPAGRADETAI